MTTKFEPNPDTEFVTTLSKLRVLIAEEVKPLEEAAFEAGRRQGAAEAAGDLRERAMISIARDRGLLPQSKPVGSLDPVEMAQRARKLQAEASENGQELSNTAAVRLAYEQAGVALQ